jgi:hypothetical protein
MDFWSTVAGVASIVVILTGIIKSIQWWRTPAHKLEATVGWNSFKLPPQIRAEFAEQAKNITRTIEEFQSENPEQEGGDAAYRRADDLAWRIRHRLEGDVSYQLQSLKGCWLATVKNIGKKKCVDVNLRLPNAIRASLKHDREENPTAIDVSEIVPIGELRPKGECEVIAWTNWSLRNSDYASVNLTHEAGVGKVHGEWRTDRFGYVAAYVLKFFGLGVFMSAFWLALLVAIGWVVAHSQRQPSSASPVRENSRLLLGYEEFATRYRELDGRDREQEEYVAAAVGKEVAWDVRFERATTGSYEVLFSFGMDNGGPPVQMGSVPMNQRDRNLHPASWRHNPDSWPTY